jgi:large subunit ribosomal protein L37Ae
MSTRTKKVGIAGKYGPRYGIRIRRRLYDVETAMRETYHCPACTYGVLKRVSTGIYSCRRCGAKIASSAYYPTPPKAITKKLEEVQETTAATGTKGTAPTTKTPPAGDSGADAKPKVKKVKKIVVEEKKEEEKNV